MTDQRLLVQHLLASLIWFACRRFDIKNSGRKLKDDKNRERKRKVRERERKFNHQNFICKQDRKVKEE